MGPYEFQLLGALTTFWIFSYVIRNTLFRKNKKKASWVYAAIILTILSPILSGIGGANEGSFNINDALVQVIAGFIYIVIFTIYSLVGSKNVDSTDFEEKHMGIVERTFLIVISVIVYGVLIFSVVVSINRVLTSEQLFNFGSTTDNNVESQEIVRGLLEIVEETNKTVPRMADKATRLDKMYLSGYDLIDVNWAYTIIDYDSPMRSYDFGKINTDMISRICSTEDYKFDFDSGISFNYVYHDNNGNEINRVRVDKKICKNQLNSAPL